MIGHRPVDQVEPHEVLAVLKRQEVKGNLETAKRTRAFASRVFRYAVITARAKSDPASLLLGAVAARARSIWQRSSIRRGRASCCVRSTRMAGNPSPGTRWGCLPTCSFGRASCGKPNGLRSTLKLPSGASQPDA